MPIYCPIEFVNPVQDQFTSLDYKIMSHLFASQNELGNLADERIYQSDVAARLTSAGYKVDREVPVTVEFDSFNKKYVLDLVVHDRIIYEMKAVSGLAPQHEMQLLNYLILLDLDRGKLINFGSPEVETQFVNSPISRAARQAFNVTIENWSGGNTLKDFVIEVIRDWGTGLELPLYHQAIVHFLGREDNASTMLPLNRGPIKLGNQRFYLTDSESAFRITAFSKDRNSYESQLKSLLKLSPLSAIHWINIALHEVNFSTIRNI